MTLISSITALAKLEEGAGRRCSQKAVGTTLIALGAVLVLVSVLFASVLPPVIDDTVRSGVVTCSTSSANKLAFTDMYGDCADCTPYYTNLYLFNVTNAEAHLALSTKLKVTEVGPYAFRKRQIRLDASVQDNRVQYKQYTYYTFEPSRSCKGCSDLDTVVAYDTGYLNVISQAGGERAFLTALAMGTFAAGANVSAAAAKVAVNAPQLMRWINGLNSLDADAMKTVTANGLVFQVLLGGPAALTNVTMDGFAYNGLFAKRTVAQWALGYPSLLAGLGLGANYVNVCQTGGLEKQCASCSGAACLPIAAECKKCAQGKAVVAVNPLTCGTIEAIYAAKFGEAEAKTFAAATCGTLCTSSGLCAAPLPGAIESSGLDFSKTAPSAETLGLYAQRTGCDDSAVIGEYETFNGANTTAIWATLDSRRNPTLAEIAAFGTYSNCASPATNVTCARVQGGDGLTIAPGGVGMTGFEDAIARSSINLFLEQTKTNISVVKDTSRGDVAVSGIPLHRFAPPTDLLTYSAEKAAIGTGYPVDGVQSLAFTSGFLAYLSFPMFLFGDASLLNSVSITMRDGVEAAADTLYVSSGVVTDAYADAYLTSIDIEAGTGKTMRARKRLQASYAVARSSVDPTLAMTDVLWPVMKPEVIVPVYWGEDSATIGEKQIDTYRSIRALLHATLPTVIAGPIVGLAVIAWGIVKRRRGKQFMRAHASSII